MNNLKLLAKCPDLNVLTREAVGYEVRTTVGGAVVKVPLEARFPYFAQGFVNADVPRDSAYVDDIVTATEGWALADESGNVLGEFESAQDAENARSNATLKLEVVVPEKPKAAAKA